MHPTDLTLTEQLRLTEREVRRRLELFGIGGEEVAILRSLRPLVAPVAERIVEEFYHRQLAVEEIATLIGDADTLARLKKHQCRYILTLFDGDYGMEYVHSRLRIGLVHKRIGVPPKLYLSSFRNLAGLLRQHLRPPDQQCGSCLTRLEVVEKIMLFDLALVFDTYIHSLMDEVERGRRELRDYADSLEETVAARTRELAEQASRDGLTQLLNQRSFYEELRREVARTQRTEETLSLIYFDLDGFKAINDAFGHQQGDEILMGTARVIRRVVRVEDIAARYGGDEFCIILPHSSAEAAREVAHRLIETFDQEVGDNGVTLSIGIATAASAELTDGAHLVKQADAAMYASKKIAGHAVTLA
ncbi:MAG: GGDEF domain-containing protein [Thermodesulfobacteriota bacterium]